MDTLKHAEELDAQDALRHFRSQFQIPSKAGLKATYLSEISQQEESSPDECIYLCGNSLGLQPKSVAKHVEIYLKTWATQGVNGHFKQMKDSPLPPWLHADDIVADLASSVVGALSSEVAYMGTLTANLHLLLASFYKPSGKRTKIIIEGKAFPSDHFAVESQIRWHGLNPAEHMILLENTEDTISTEDIIKVVQENADSAAVLLLPGVQFYTGQLFDIPAITKAAQDLEIVVGWDLAHAVGNVELSLHNWNVDFAAWCSYKYLNSGPGAIGGLFVHERHGETSNGQSKPRLQGWWGSDKSSRFKMDNAFVPIPGARGFQLSNPSALDLVPVQTSLEIFKEATIPALRKKSLALTGYLESLLQDGPYQILTPRDPEQRGAQLSIKLRPGTLDRVMEHLQKNGVVIDERKPDVIRVAPAPLYNSFADVWHFCQIFKEATSL